MQSEMLQSDRNYTFKTNHIYKVGRYDSSVIKNDYEWMKNMIYLWKNKQKFTTWIWIKRKFFSFYFTVDNNTIDLIFRKIFFGKNSRVQWPTKRQINTHWLLALVFSFVFLGVHVIPIFGPAYILLRNFIIVNTFAYCS